ncbi:MAG: hypothetical protein WCF03_12380 [Nitrososphaeraceae archaeon]
MQNKQHRPMGVTIIAILTIISGILFLLSGIALVALGSFSVNPVDTTISTNTSSSRAGAQFFGIIFAGVGGVFLAIGIGYLVMFYGLLKGKGWAWTITIILLIIGIAIQIVSTSVGSVLTGFHNTNNVSSGIVDSIIGIAIDIVILYYLYRPHVKVYFGKVQPLTTV